MKQKHRIWGYIFLGIALLILIGAYYFFPDLKQFASPNYIREFLFGFGIFSYLIFILLLLLAIVLPIPSSPIVVAGGFIYGTALGTALSVFSVAVGASISFFLVRYYGRPLLEKMVDQHQLEHFHFLFLRRGPTLAFISYLVPIFPSDCVSFILGLTKIRFRDFIFIVILGHIPRFLIVNSFGEDLFLGFSFKTIIVLILLLVLILIALFREKIKKIFFKELHELEADALKAEKSIGREAKKLERAAEKEANLVERDFRKDLNQLRKKRKR